MAIRSSPRSGSSPSTSRPRAGRSATASCCRSRRTPRCSRCSARPTAATASRTSRCRISRATRRCIPGQGPGLSLHDLGETGGSDTVTLLETEIPSPLSTPCAPTRSTRPTPNVAQPDTPATRSRRRRHAVPDAVEHHAGAQALAPVGRRPAAQQPAAVPHAQLLHRPAGRVPASHLMTGAVWLRASTARTRHSCSPSTRAPAPRSSRSCDWSDEQRDAFLRQQFTAQDTYCRGLRQTPTGRHRGRRAPRRALLCRPHGERDPDRRHRARSRSSATWVSARALIGDVLAEGQRSGRPVTIHVERGNRARALYERIGFVQIDSTGVYDLLERTAS